MMIDHRFSWVSGSKWVPVIRQYAKLEFEALVFTLGINGSRLHGDIWREKAQTEKPCKGAMLRYFIEGAQQLVRLAALGQMIEAVDKIECQRADGHGETERAEQRSSVKWREQRPRLNSQVSVEQNEETVVGGFQKGAAEEHSLAKRVKVDVAVKVCSWNNARSRKAVAGHILLNCLRSFACISSAMWL